ncbi:DUF2304 domain-containing protein [Streptococcus sp. DD13]|uniref:DUF2304 domain-containing protein n=1 Tax=Streptococcus sp. DD13 TaxID=1777881 RepID=UPI000798B4D6|nr:DUF2304 domain-containing protein [Streptococcus sp. DD13]KXT79143.1 glycosyltransferase, lytic transglycosylase, dTDP-4-rhamnose reductase [Streptococcus sp. DD13]
MSLFLQIEMFVLAILILYAIIRMVNNRSFSVRRATPWLVIGLILVFISLFPQVVSWLAHRAGFALTMNFLLFAAVLFLFVLEIFDTSSSSRKEEQIKQLIQEVSLLKKEIEEKTSK